MRGRLHRSLWWCFLPRRGGTNPEIARIFGLSRERIGQVRKKLLWRAAKVISDERLRHVVAMFARSEKEPFLKFPDAHAIMRMFGVIEHEAPFLIRN